MIAKNTKNIFGIFFFVVFSLFLISNVSAIITTFVQWEGQDTSATIMEGGTIDFHVNLLSDSTPTGITIQLLKNGNVVWTPTDYEDQDPQTESWYHRYTLTQAEYGSSGSFQLKAIGTDSESSQTVTISLTVSSQDNTAPTVTITTPAGITYSTNIIDLVFTVSDPNLDICEYSLNGGPRVSVSCSQGSNTVNGLTASEGSNTWIVYATDTSGNEGNDSISFTVDTVSPGITINSPTNTTIASSSVSLDITTDENSVFAWYSIDGGATNISLTGSGTSFTGTAVLSDGSYTMDFYAQDASGNVGTNSVSFTVDTSTADTNAPAVTISFPQNIQYSSEITQLIYSAVDPEGNLNQCWYSTDLGTTNSTPVACGTTFSITSTEGINTWTVYASDLAGNVGSTTVTFNVNFELFDDDGGDSDKKVSFVFQDPLEDEYLSQINAQPPAPTIDLTPEVEKKASLIVRFFQSIIDFFKRLFGF